MKKRVIQCVFILAALLVLQSNVTKTKSTGAPACSTGAPGELTCDQQGCHSSYPRNSGKAVLSIACDGNGNYVPGETYSISPAVFDSLSESFGFEIVALDSLTNQNAGSFVTVDNSTTQILKGFGNLTDRTYITYKVAGTEPVSPGLGQWNLQWKAPSKSVGPVKFYVAAIAADGDHTQAGDHVFTKVYTMKPVSVSGGITRGKNSLENDVVYPNPVKSDLHIKKYFTNATQATVELINIQGQTVQILFSGHIETGLYSESFKVSDTIAQGFYFLKLNTEARTFTYKILLKNEK